MGYRGKRRTPDRCAFINGSDCVRSSFCVLSSDQSETQSRKEGLHFECRIARLLSILAKPQCRMHLPCELAHGCSPQQGRPAAIWALRSPHV